MILGNQETPLEEDLEAIESLLLLLLELNIISWETFEVISF